MFDIWVPADTLALTVTSKDRAVACPNASVPPLVPDAPVPSRKITHGAGAGLHSAGTVEYSA